MSEHPLLTAFKNNIDSLVAAIAGATFIYILTHYHGIGISPDSVTYAGVARNIRAGKWLIEFNDNPLIIFPAGYPVFLGTISTTFAKDILAIAPAINAFLIGLVIYINGCIVEQFTHRNKWHKWMILSILPISYALLDVYTMLWSETLFMLLVCLFISTLRKYLAAPTLLHLVWPALFTAIACDTRIAGISILGTGLLLIILQTNFPILKKLGHLLFFGGIGITLILANLLRNQRLNGTMTGIRQKSITPLLTNIQYFGETVLKWFQLPDSLQHYATPVGILLLLFMTAFIAFRYWISRRMVSFETIYLVFAFVYISFIIFTATVSKYEKINNRLLSPAFIPLIISLTFFIPFQIRKIKTGLLKTAIIGILILVFGVLQYNQLMAARELNAQISDMGVPGYTEIEWHESDIVHFLETKRNFFIKDSTVYSNACDAVYFYSLIPAVTLPEMAHKADLQEYYECDPSYIVWFTNEFDNKAIVRLDTIAKHRHLDTLAKFNEGMVLWSQPK